MEIQTVLVRGPNGRAFVLLIVGRTETTYEVTDNEGLIMLRHGDDSRIATVRRRDVFAIVNDVKTGDSPDWLTMAHI
jgi:hypothetical protein